MKNQTLQIKALLATAVTALFLMGSTAYAGHEDQELIPAVKTEMGSHEHRIGNSENGGAPSTPVASTQDGHHALPTASYMEQQDMSNVVIGDPFYFDTNQ